MTTTLLDLVRDVRRGLYGYVEVKDRRIYMNADILAGATTFVTSSLSEAKSLQSGQILQFGGVSTSATELVRVRSVDTSTNTVTMTRGVMGTTAAAWAAATTEISVEPEYPTPDIVREINNTILGLPPDIWAVKTQVGTVQGFEIIGYSLPNTAKGIVSVAYLDAGPSGLWRQVRRYRYDGASKQVEIFQAMQPGQTLKIVYRADPTPLTLDTDTLDGTAGLGDSCRQVVQWGAVYRLLMGRGPSRLIDTRAESPQNQQYRQADPVNAAVRQVFQLYKERVAAERERQRLEWPVQFTYTF